VCWKQLLTKTSYHKVRVFVCFSLVACVDSTKALDDHSMRQLNGEHFYTFLVTTFQISQQSAKRSRWVHS
jgi:hypothetical protein